MKLNISIIGFGNVGRQICALLLTYNQLELSINIMEISEDAKGAFLDFQHGVELFPQHELHWNDQALFNDSDYIFHCAGASVPKGESRLTTCQASIEISEAIFKSYKPEKYAKVIVVANPVEIISFVTQQLTGLPPENVVSTGTLLDSIRMNYYLEEKYPHLGQAEVVLLGEHGSSVFESAQLSKVGGKPLHELLNDMQIEQLLEQTKNAAEDIKATQDATIYGVSFCAMQLFDAFLSEKLVDTIASIQVTNELQDKLDCPPIHLSLPVQISKDGAMVRSDYEPITHDMDGLKGSIDLILPCIPSEYLA